METADRRSVDGMSPVVSRQDVLRFRFRRHELHRPPGSITDPSEVAILDYGVQDTGHDGAAWALAVRGAELDQLPDDLPLAWTLRGAPHAYRRADLAAVAVATAPYDEVDAAKRIFDASKPLKEAGIGILDALTEVADHLRDIVTEPMSKGDVSARLTDLVDEPFLRFCRPCQATHVYEQPFRLAALQAGLELESGTAPPVMRRIPKVRPTRFLRLADGADPRLDVIRNQLRFYGPATTSDTATFLDAPVKVVQAHWPTDAVEVSIDRPDDDSTIGYVLAGDLDELTGGGGAEPAVRLLGPYDPYLQLRDRELLVADEARRKDLWRVLGRPGAIVSDGEVVGTWRPKSAGRKLTVRIELWARDTKRLRSAIGDEAERLAAHRQVTLAAV